MMILGGTGIALLQSLGGPLPLQAEDSRRTEYRLPLNSEPATLDPARISDIYAVNVALNVFDGLVEFDKDLNIVPAIARRWIISRDHRVYTFYLREGVRFHNGREVVAEDFVYSLQRILSPSVQSPCAPLLYAIRGGEAYHAGTSAAVEGLKALDPLTLQIELEEPFAPFLAILAMANAKVVPREAVDDGFSRAPVGTGPFRFHTWEPSRSIVLHANEDYYGGRPALDELHFRIYPNDPGELIFQDFENNLLDQAVIPRSRYEEVVAGESHKNRYQWIRSPGLNLVYVGMNATIPPLDNVKVRKAVFQAVDRLKIVNEITGKGSLPANGILPPGIAGHDPDLVVFPHDPDAAKALLAEAGYPGGQSIPPLEIWTASKDAGVHRELAAYRASLAAIGIELVVRTADDWKHFVSQINDRKVPLFYAAWYADYPDADNFLHVLCHSKSPMNRMGFSDPEVDRMLEEARHEMDYMSRVEKYRTIQRKVLSKAVLIPQHVNSFNCLFQPWVRNVELSYLGPAYVPYRKIYLTPGRKLAEKETR